jgi:hypothetical protein
MVEEELITMKVFYSYASEDQALRDQLEKHLGNLTRQGIITSWSNAPSMDQQYQVERDWRSPAMSSSTMRRAS